MFLLAGCALREEEETGSQPVSSSWEEDAESSDETEYEDSETEEEDGGDGEEDLFAEENGGFYYGQLPETQQDLYRDFFETI